MRIRVIRCEDESHDLPWVLAKDCTHWSMTCPRAKKAKKAHHKLKRSGGRGFPVAVTGIPAEGWTYDYDPPEEALTLSEKHYEGHWCPGPQYRFHQGCGIRLGVSETDKASLGSVFVKGPESNIIECALGCGLVGAV